MLHIPAMLTRLAVQGLAYTHRRERVHRRLTPDNLLLAWGDAGPERLSLQLMDLSLSADISDACMLGGATLAALWHGQKERDNPLCALCLSYLSWHLSGPLCLANQRIGGF